MIKQTNKTNKPTAITKNKQKRKEKEKDYTKKLQAVVDICDYGHTRDSTKSFHVLICHIRYATFYENSFLT